jgi:hypothetical protein
MKRLEAEEYRAANLECARTIAADPERYGGPESLMVQWALMVLNPPAERTKPMLRRPA